MQLEFHFYFGIHVTSVMNNEFIRASILIAKRINDQCGYVLILFNVQVVSFKAQPFCDPVLIQIGVCIGFVLYFIGNEGTTCGFEAKG